MMKRFLIAAFLLCICVVSASAANRFAVCTTTCTWDNSSTAMWSTSSGGAAGASAPAITDDVIFDAATCVGGATCTATVNANLSIRSLVMGTCTATTTGCILDFSINNNNIAFADSSPALSISGTGTRTLRMGSGNWSFINSLGTMITAATSTNLTLTAGTSTIIATLTTAGGQTTTFNTGTGLTWGNFTLNANLSTGGRINMVGGTATFANVIVNGPNFGTKMAAAVTR